MTTPTYKVLGTRPIRHDGVDKVTGRAVYGADLQMAGLLHGRVLRSPIPHGRIKGLKNPLAAVLRVRQPIAFDAPDDEPVSLLIFLLVPEAATQRHLEILSEIAEMLSDRELRERLKSEPLAAEVHRIIASWEPLKSVA